MALLLVGDVVQEGVSVLLLLMAVTLSVFVVAFSMVFMAEKSVTMTFPFLRSRVCSRSCGVCNEDEVVRGEADPDWRFQVTWRNAPVPITSPS